MAARTPSELEVFLRMLDRAGVPNRSEDVGNGRRVVRVENLAVRGQDGYPGFYSLWEFDPDGWLVGVANLE